MTNEQISPQKHLLIKNPRSLIFLVAILSCCVLLMGYVSIDGSGTISSMANVVDWSYCFNRTTDSIHTKQDHEDKDLTILREMYAQDLAFAMPPVTPMVSTTRLFYTRFPKCGSTTTLFLLKGLNKQNHWHYPTDLSNSAHYLERKLLPKCRGCKEKGETVHNKELTVVEVVSKTSVPALLSGHMTYIDFRRYQSSNYPIYISIVREPLERLISLYYYNQKKRKLYRNDHILNELTYDGCVEENLTKCVAPNVHGFFTMVPFFCGNDPICQYQNEAALRIAKRNILRDYAVIGLSEYYKETLKVLEHIFPQYFNGLPQLFRSRNESSSNKTPGKVPPKISTIIRMKSLLTMEYELYDFVKQRFLFQYDSYLNKSM